MRLPVYSPIEVAAGFNLCVNVKEDKFTMSHQPSTINHQQCYADLHLHTIHSDAEYTPERLVKDALTKGFRAIAVTDHDSVGAFPEILDIAPADLEVIPGIELSAEMENDVSPTGGARGPAEMHIVGLFMDYTNPHLLEALDKLARGRKERMYKILEQLEEMGVHLEEKDIKKYVRGEIVGRLHIAQALKDKGWTSTVWEAFNKYLGDGKPAYVDRYRLSSSQVISLIKEAGGIPVLGHPHLMKSMKILPRLIEEGLEGLEVYHPDHGRKPSPSLLKLAREYGLVVSGGSDCHGIAKEKVLLGKVRIPYAVVEDLKRWRAQQIKNKK